MKLLIIIGLVVAICNASPRHTKFPDDFLFGTATASYQIEGGWNADDKAENIWDRMTHTKPEVIKDGSNGDVAADTYNNYKRDVEMMRELGLDAYRFSLSWARILPNGLTNKVSEAGVAFYNNYIDEMLKYNITPMVTLYHWDLPQKLQDFGGFLNPHFPNWFESYARVVYEKFGDRVKHWITFNEPREICFEGYGHVTKAPVLNATDLGTYHCGKNLVYYIYINAICIRLFRLYFVSGFALGSLVGGLLYSHAGGRGSFRIFAGMALIASGAHALLYAIVTRGDKDQQKQIEMTPPEVEKMLHEENSNAIYRDTVVPLTDKNKHGDR